MNRKSDIPQSAVEFQASEAADPIAPSTGKATGKGPDIPKSAVDFQASEAADPVTPSTGKSR